MFVGGCEVGAIGCVSDLFSGSLSSLYVLRELMIIWPQPVCPLDFPAGPWRCGLAPLHQPIQWTSSKPTTLLGITRKEHGDHGQRSRNRQGRRGRGASSQARPFPTGARMGQFLPCSRYPRNTHLSPTCAPLSASAHALPARPTAFLVPQPQWLQNRRCWHLGSLVRLISAAGQPTQTKSTTEIPYARDLARRDHGASGRQFGQWGDCVEFWQARKG
ncbi:hypothetical protein FH972_025889 [Carpinus fangiana]|uniref:Uncharacterized protein n=1 Tax=Carpinus fangiana TaxID=176857 RepID=A0A5N6L2W1_9ROSI|nr:hypothetical protein FH972_025889 [Carpinus fangiana]